MKTDKQLIDEICEATADLYPLDYVVSEKTAYESRMQELTLRYGKCFDEIGATTDMAERLEIADRMREILEEKTRLKRDYDAQHIFRHQRDR